eukprot:CAMPEP_0170369172 /NCGR_PEP_ID=MMETSP0117_2-20130122/7843_1 /TAXON_ID=400756 /ORGANISM="Durinskia baltica, Strain CSIRO CS-38" /LENGTH=459 /DNA_ID=CAMNT_0010623877 /DNA_START=1 /DNA_END=1380 /DNA_ORIENTATION=+
MLALAVCLWAFAAKALASTLVEQMTLSFDSDPSKLMFSFAAFSNETNAQFWWGTDKYNFNNYVNVTGIQYNLNGYTSPMIYKGTITGLTPGNTIYYYSGGSDALGWSDENYFKTHPGVGVEDVTFHVFGDLGQTENSANTLNELIAYEKALSSKTGGILSMGDLSYANGDEPLWDSFGKLITLASGHIPMMTTYGNHEWFDSRNHDFTAVLSRYNNPKVDGERQLYYSFESGLVHWVMISGYCQEMKTVYTQPCLAEGSPQMNWLTKDLAGVDRTKTPWVIAVFHQPYVNSNDAHSMDTEGAPMQKAVEDVLNQYKVDLVFSGHVHAYERSCQVYQYECTPGAPYYITIGDGGNLEGLAETWLEPQPAWSSFRQASYGFGELRVVNSTSMEWRWHQNQDLLPTIADEYTFTKPSDGQMLKTAGASKPVTGHPVFADNARGHKAEQYNAAQTKLYSKSPR